jgi:hypothetical protein
VTAALAVTGLGLTPAVVVGTASAGQASASRSWRVVETTKSAFLSGLVAPSRHNIWALGTGTVSGQPGKAFPFGRHWNGRRWSKVSFPAAIAKTGSAARLPRRRAMSGPSPVRHRLATGPQPLARFGW